MGIVNIKHSPLRRSGICHRAVTLWHL